MGIQAPARIKFELIQKALLEENNMLNVSQMCDKAGVSRRGYYTCCKNEPKREEQEARDRADFAIILEAYKYRGHAKGARGIHMRLLHVGVRMNVKKIRRLMKKYGLKCPIRERNPYKEMLRVMRTGNIAPNVVERQFVKYGARKVLLTDITYLFYRNGKCYLSTILDAYTREILAYQVSESLEVRFVIETVDMLVEEHGMSLDETTIVHSDQGAHYTSREFIERLKSEGFVQSMSRKGNCWDNAPQESFFGHMKDEIRDEIAECVKFEEVKAVVDEWIDYYNNDRYQWDLKKLSPREYYEYEKTGIYPLSEWKESWGSAPNPEV